MVVGDSWASLLSVFHTFGDVQRDLGFKEYADTGVHIPGSKAREWNTPGGKWMLWSHLQAHPNVDIVVLSLGGNDLMSRYNTGLSEGEVDAIFHDIRADLEAVVDFLLSVRPSIRVCLLGYDYPNFVESLESDQFPWNRDRHRKLGEPTPRWSNETLARFAAMQHAVAADHDRTAFVNNMGLMQSAFGYPSLGIASGTLPGPDPNPGDPHFMGGDPDLPCPPDAMIRLENFVDSIHLTRPGYYVIGRRVMEQCLLAWLQDPLPLLQGKSTPDVGFVKVAQ
jgi:lysophospholipase L1-like esterase